MAAQNAEGIILRKYLLRETSYILVVLTKEFGKIKGVIKGVREPYPQFAGNFEILTRCQLLFYRKKKSSLDLITRCESVDCFLPVRKEIERLTYANYFVELADMVANDRDVNEELYSVLLGSLHMLASGISAGRTGRIFELKFLAALGLSPRMDSCAGCGTAVDQHGRFSVKDGGMVCRVCGGHAERGLRISQGTINFISKIQRTDMDRTSRVKVSKEVGLQTEKVLSRFLRYHINRPVKSLKFLKQLQSEGIC